MAHEIPKLLLEHAGTVLERAEAIRTALKMGMPLAEIEAYLDWLDAVRPLRNGGPAADDSPQKTPPPEADPPRAT